MVVTEKMMVSWNGLLQTKTQDIDLEILRAIIRACHQIESKNKSENVPSETAENESILQSSFQVSDMLMIHLRIGFSTPEAQVLCSTAFFALCSVLPREQQISSLGNTYKILSDHLKELESVDAAEKCTKSKQIDPDYYIMSIVSGLFQTSVLKNNFASKDLNLCISFDIVNISFKIMAKACLKYSTHTFLCFKNVLAIVKKIFEWEIEDKVSRDTQNILLFVIANNWENTITGIRELNSKLWSLYLQLINKNNMFDLFNNLLAAIMRFPWNKAKYFILCDVIPYFRNNLIDFLRENPTCVNGLEYSLRNTSLVSAGSDLYKAIINHLHTYEDWSVVFIDLFKKLLKENIVIQAYLLNHWLPATIKKFPIFYKILLDKIYFNGNILTETDYYPLLSLLKIGRKNGFIMTDWNERQQFNDVINIGLDHINEEIRSQAFQVVCNTKKNNIPKKEEFDIVKYFLTYNINNDSTPFRRNNLNCFTLFLIRLRDASLNLLRSKDYNESGLPAENLKIVESFFVWCYDFLTTNLDDTGNYQRKILSLQMYDVILRYLCGGYNDIENIRRSLCRKGNQRDQGWMVVAFLENRNKWFFNSEESVQTLVKCISDPTNDVREITANILAQYYRNNSYLIQRKQDFFVNGIILCNSRMFYETESGCLMFKIIGSLSQNDVIESLISPSTNITEYLTQKAWEQFTCQENDLLFSIFNNQPLHGMLSAIVTSMKHSNTRLSQSLMDNLIKLLTAINTHFLNTLAFKSDTINKDFPPSFAEMGGSIEYVIATSMFKPDESQHNDQLLSNAHQLVLNNIWLNLKACCELSSTLIITCTEELGEKNVMKCLDVIIFVLTRCRHKGAIESAGVSLGRSVKHLTGSCNAAHRELVSVMLENFLVQATCEDVHGGSITRRSAGLTILVHRIVSNDSQPSKPLFHHTMTTLLQVLSSSKPEAPSQKQLESLLLDGDVSNARDIPLARALHLLCRTVSESSLAGYVIQFASQLAMVCFRHLTSEQWQIRNAALQLYGALVPKLIGQKKTQEEEESAESPMSADELFSHIPSLWRHIHKELKESCNDNFTSNTLLVHSNLVPILSLLSSMSKRSPLNPFYKEECQKAGFEVVDVKELFPFLAALLGSPIYTVRNITAKILESFYDVEVFQKHWSVRKKFKLKENELHGILLTLKYYVKYFKASKQYLLNESECKSAVNVFYAILKNTEVLVAKKCNSSYVVKALQFEIKHLLNHDIKAIDYMNQVYKGVDLLSKSNSIVTSSIGFHQCLYLRISLSVMHCNQNDLECVTELCLRNKDFPLFNYFLPALDRRLKTKMPDNPYVLQKIFQLVIELFTEDNKYIRKNIFEILYQLACNIPALKTHVSCDNFFKVLYPILNTKNTVHFYKHGYLLPLLCILKCNKFNLDTDDLKEILELCKLCKILSEPEKCDTERRFVAAVSTQHLIKTLHYFNKNNTPIDNLTFDIIFCILITVLRLLQDEDCNVRNECSKIILQQCVNNKNKPKFTYANRQIDNILNSDFVSMTFSQSSQLCVKFLEAVLGEMFNVNDDERKGENDLQNPFDHNTSNVFWESRLLERSLLHLIGEFKGK